MKLFPRLSGNTAFLCAVVAATIFVAGGPLSAAEQTLRGVNVTPDQEKRSCIQSVDGYAYLSEDKTLSEIRAAAFANAKRQAVENARTFIQSKTQVENFELKSDKITATTEGAVTVLEQKDFGIEDNHRYHVWIKAEVEYKLRPSGGPSGDDAAAAGPLTVGVWTSKKTYRDGEAIEILLKGNRDFYARIVDVTASGEIIQLLPNAYRSINRFDAGKVYKIPDAGDHFTLKVSPPYGKDQIVVYASEAPLGRVDMESAGQGLGMYRGSRESLGIRTRGISVAGSAVGSDSGQAAPAGAEFYEASWTLQTQP
ncbi:MAG: DUF4384 domain-containing protein [Desulfobacterales bacterium]|jgi:hypothetical protein